MATGFVVNTGAKIPSVGLGTWQADNGVVGDAVYAAVKVSPSLIFARLALALVSASTLLLFGSAASAGVCVSFMLLLWILNCHFSVHLLPISIIQSTYSILEFSFSLNS